jgi:hypothetical protein
MFTTPVSSEEMQIAGAFMATITAGALAANLCGRWAPGLRKAVAAACFAAIVGITLYHLIVA